MQNKHRNFFHFKVDQLPGRGGGGPPVGPKDQLFPFFFWRLPLDTYLNVNTPWLKRLLERPSGSQPGVTWWSSQRLNCHFANVLNMTVLIVGSWQDMLSNHMVDTGPCTWNCHWICLTKILTRMCWRTSRALKGLQRRGHDTGDWAASFWLHVGTLSQLVHQPWLVVSSVLWNSCFSNLQIGGPVDCT